MRCLIARGTDEQLSRNGLRESPCQDLHAQAGPVSGIYQYLHAAKSEASTEIDMQRYFKVSPPSVHQTVPAFEPRDSSGTSQGEPAASKCSLIRNFLRSFANPQFNRSKSLCGATRTRSGNARLRLGS